MEDDNADSDALVSDSDADDGDATAADDGGGSGGSGGSGAVSELPWLRVHMDTYTSDVFLPRLRADTIGNLNHIANENQIQIQISFNLYR